MAYRDQGKFDAAYLHLGYPMLGRLISIFCSGGIGTLAACYLFIHSKSDPRWLLCLAMFTFILLLGSVGLLIKLGYTTVILGADAAKARWQWELVANQVVQAIVPTASQGYLIYRYHALSRGSSYRGLLTATLATLAFVQFVCYLSITPISLYAHFSGAGPAMNEEDRRLNQVIEDLYTSALSIAAFLDTILAILFCRRLWSLRVQNSHLARSLCWVMKMATLSGLATTCLTIVTLVYFRSVRDDSFRIVAELAPPFYCGSFFLALLSRERVRSSLQKAQDDRVRAALEQLAAVNVLPMMDVEPGTTTGDVYTGNASQESVDELKRLKDKDYQLDSMQAGKDSFAGSREGTSLC